MVSRLGPIAIVDTMRKIAVSQLPSITSLRCFETAARHLSFTSAAKELFMTQSAVGKQVALLERVLDCELFIRHKQRIELTPIGEKFLYDTQDILRKIEDAVLNVLSHGNAVATLNIIANPTFCARWLVVLLKGFGKAHPNIHLEFHDHLGELDSNMINDMDLGFLHGAGDWPGMTSIKLFDCMFVPVCAPEIETTELSQQGCSEGVTLIQTRLSPRAWNEYFLSANVKWEGLFTGPRFDSFYDAIHAAICGCGVALVPDVLVREELNHGDLKLAWNHKLDKNWAYYMVHPSNKTGVPHVKILMDWILNRVQKD